MQIRKEISSDREAVYAINLAAFPTDAEAQLVERLRAGAYPIISLVAQESDSLVGHILFSPVTLDSDPTLALMGLAPMAVLPNRQGSGIGSALVAAGLQYCTELGVGAVAVLGHPDFYAKFGFIASAKFGITSEYDVPAEVFMLKELSGDYLKNCTGTIRYHAEFGKL